jgi:hypothetical protein
MFSLASIKWLVVLATSSAHSTEETGSELPALMSDCVLVQIADNVTGAILQSFTRNCCQLMRRHMLDFVAPTGARPMI